MIDINVSPQKSPITFISSPDGEYEEAPLLRYPSEEEMREYLRSNTHISVVTYKNYVIFGLFPEAGNSQKTGGWDMGYSESLHVIVKRLFYVFFQTTTDDVDVYDDYGSASIYINVAGELYLDVPHGVLNVNGVKNIDTMTNNLPLVNEWQKLNPCRVLGFAEVVYSGLRNCCYFHDIHPFVSAIERMSELAEMSSDQFLSQLIQAGDGTIRLAWSGYYKKLGMCHFDMPESKHNGDVLVHISVNKHVYEGLYIYIEFV